MQGVKSYVPKSELELPKVIVIGGKSAGKSSLLENITKCSVFPRDRDLCTKRPVKLQLKQVDTTRVTRGTKYSSMSYTRTSALC